MWKDRNLPPRVSVPLPRKARLDAADVRPSDAFDRPAEFYKIGLTDCYGRPIYVQRW